MSLARPFVYEPPSDPLVVLHSDEHLLVLAKPAGLLSVPGKPTNHSDCLIVRARARFPAATLVHRLDCATSGVMVCALTRQAHRHLGLQFERRKLTKSYVARVWGRMAGDDGVVEAPLCCDWPNRPMQMIDFERGRPAVTRWRVMAREAMATRVRLMPQTGRSHQLRVHMASLGHPVLGDALYASCEAYAAAERMHLHAETLTLRHPEDGRSISFTDPCPF